MSEDIDWTPLKEPGCFAKIIIAVTMLISWLFWQPKGKQKG